MKTKMQVESRAISTIHPYEKNAKKHPKDQIEKIANSIKEFGFNQPIVVDKLGIIIVGHGRYEAALSLKMDEVPVLVADLPEDKAKAYRLADNKLNESDWDMELVIGELSSLSSELLQLTGFDNEILLDPAKDPDAVPSFLDTVRSSIGDLYEFGGNRVLCGDSTKIEDIERLMGDERAAMVFTDPPYNVNYGATMKDKLRGTDNRKILNDEFKNKDDFYRFLYDSMVSMRPFVIGDVYIAMSSSELHTLQRAFEDAGGHWSTFIIWVKNNFTIGRSNYQRQYEPILYGWFDGSSHYWSGRRNLGDVVKDQIREEADGSHWLKVQNGGIETDIWPFDKPRKNKEHPTMKPVELMERAIVNSSLPENIVLDPFLGSGSTLIAANKNKRRCFGMELDPKYVDVVIQRYVDYTGDKNITKNGKKETWGSSNS